MAIKHPAAQAPDQSDERRARQRWMAVLAKSDFTDLDALWNSLPSRPTWTVVRAPEIGMVMARGRAGGTGQRFNLGEVTVTRCAVRLEYGAIGFGYVMGRNKRHAELAAAVDAMLQTPSRRETLERAIIAPLTLQLEEKRLRRSRKAAATKVEFFTMVRGS